MFLTYNKIQEEWHQYGVLGSSTMLGFEVIYE